jgi:hypothetical protein
MKSDLNEIAGSSPRSGRVNNTKSFHMHCDFNGILRLYSITAGFESPNLVDLLLVIFYSPNK